MKNHLEGCTSYKFPAILGLHRRKRRPNKLETKPSRLHRTLTLVCAYTNDKRHHFQRVSEFHDGKIRLDAEGEARGPDGLLVEDFDMIDNLMMHGGVENRSGLLEVHQAAEDEMFTDMTGYRRVLERLAASLS